MRFAEALACAVLAALAAAADVPRPRGVGPEFAKYYKDADSFACISNPSIVLPVARVNDDYCDCPDGSDEPGTAACAHLSPLSPRTPANPNGDVADASLALPGFYCKNKGHRPAYVPFTSVNDGHCDYDICCDGSEEWAGLVKCEDRCNEIGKEWRKAEEARQKSAANALRRRRELVASAAKSKEEVQTRLRSATAEVEGSERRIHQLEQELADAERKDKGKVVRAGQTGGKLGVLVGLARQRTTELRDSLIRVREQRDSSRERVEELEKILSTFKEEYNPNFNDEGVKRAVRAWEDYAAREKDDQSASAADRDLDEITQEDTHHGIDWTEFESDESSDADVLYAFENYLPPTVRAWLDQKLRDLWVALIDAGILADSSSSAGEGKAVSAARERLSAAEKSLKDQRKSRDEATKDLETDFGPDDIFRALKGGCVSVDSGEYTYEVCFMESTTQKPKKGGGNTNMGRFTRLDRVVVDDEASADGKGLGSGERIAMKFENGQHCWNGPSRSTTVIMACAEENEIWKVMEEEKCVYRIELGTPAVCEPAQAMTNGQNAQRDEL